LEYDPGLAKYFSKYKYQTDLEPNSRFYLIQILSTKNGSSPEQKNIFMNSEFTENELKSTLKNCYQKSLRFNLLRKQFFEMASQDSSMRHLVNPDTQKVFEMASQQRLVKPKEHQTNSDFVRIGSSEKVIGEIETAVNCNLPILLHGKPGSGKTTIVEEANLRFGNQGNSIIKIRIIKDSFG
jgi:chromosomal replication initiation ATPase DnaA